MKKSIIFLSILFTFVIFFGSVASAESSQDIIKQGNSGPKVVQIQRRLKELGYLNYRATGKFSEMTANAVRKFQSHNNIAPDGQVGSETMQKILSYDTVASPINPAVKKVFGPAFSGKVKDRGELSSWQSIQTSFPIGANATITDFNSGATYEAQRTGGVNCAQVVPLTTTDYNAYFTSFGGGESWEHRPVLVSVGGQTYAASLFGTPSGGTPLNQSGMKGYATLYFNNSTTDVLSLADEEHILALTSAAKKS